MDTKVVLIVRHRAYHHQNLTPQLRRNKRTASDANNSDDSNNNNNNNKIVHTQAGENTTSGRSFPELKNKSLFHTWYRLFIYLGSIAVCVGLLEESGVVIVPRYRAHRHHQNVTPNVTTTNRVRRQQQRQQNRPHANGRNTISGCPFPELEKKTKESLFPYNRLSCTTLSGNIRSVCISICNPSGPYISGVRALCAMLFLEEKRCNRTTLSRAITTENLHTPTAPQPR